MARYLPYTSDDLRYIADQVDKITETIGTDDLTDGDWRWGLTVDIYDDDGETAGQMSFHGDGWIGFYPKAIAKEDES